MRLVTAQQMKELDRRATEEGEVPSLELMENAGTSVFEVASRMLGSPVGKRIIIMAGRGNNGGDGFVAARYLVEEGADVGIFLIGDPKEVQGDAKVNMEAAERDRIPLAVVTDPADIPELHDVDLIIDALLGTGIKGKVAPSLTGAINAINESECPVLAVDVPSGIDADTGAIHGVCVKANATVTFALPKLGLFLLPGAEYVGELTVADIGIPKRILKDSGSKVSAITSEFAARSLLARPCDAHKGDFGHLAVLAGSVGMTGAAALTAEGGLRIGAGLVTLGAPQSLNDILEVKLTEVMTLPIPESGNRCFGLESVEAALELIDRCDAVAIGPGLGRREETVVFIREILPKIQKPMVIDADGLNAIAENVGAFDELQSPTIITPHPGELARLIGTEVGEIQSKRLEIAAETAELFGVVVVLKGAKTVIADPSGETFINPTGNPGMASGGVGDVLTGAIGGLLAQGVSPLNAAVCGVYLHGLAGDLAMSEIGKVGLIAGDVLRALPKAISV